ncbi:MAG: GerAB/ArcD/ProY family transporter [Clostridia bacterium]|nr:GerAB/ArcD/ProY family transporter [Clostridia bacterium]
MKKQLTINQASTLIFLCSIAMKISILPGYMSTTAKEDFWLVTLLMFITEILTLLIIWNIAKRNPEKTFFELIGENFNIPIKKIVEIMLLIFILLKTLLSIYQTKIFIRNTIYEEFNEWIFLLTFVVFLIFVANNSYTSLGRTSEIVVYSAFVAIIISLMLSVLEIDISNILPLFPNGIFPLVDSFGKSSMWFGDYLLLLVFMGNIKFEKQSIKRFYVYYGIMILFVIIFFITFNCLYKNTTSIHQTAISDVSHFIPRFNDFRLDWISDILWIFVQVFTCGIWFSVSKNLFCHTFNIKKYDYLVPIGFSIIVILVMNLLQIQINNYVNFLGTYCFWITSILSQLPFILFIVKKINKRRKKYENAT